MKPLAILGLIALRVVSAECEPGQISLVFLGGVRNQELCHAPNDCGESL
jgi:hypothetical protein